MINKEVIHSPGTNRLFWILFGLTILTLLGMQITGAPLKTDVAQGGIVTFELAGTLSGSQTIIESWQGSKLAWAGINMGLDFLFLVLYSITIALGCLILAYKMPQNLQALTILGKWMAMGIMVAAGLDVIENLALILLLTGSENALLPQLARGVALPKFGLVFLALLYLVSVSLVDRMNIYDRSRKNI